MDPEATLRLIETAIREGRPNADISAAIQAIGSYYQWRLKGGFEPYNGDARADAAVSALADMTE